MHEVSFLKQIHLQHHKSRVPTPLAAASFSFEEAFIQGFFYVLAVMVVPLHWSVLITFYTFLTWISTWGHMEFEWWPNFLYRFPYSYSFNSLTTHNMHHYFGTGNYALYYRFWDEVCGTSHPKTYKHFYDVRKRIQEHFGKEESLLRPHPNDQAGLYFEELMNYGEDIDIKLGPLNHSSEPQILSRDSFYTVPHRHCDGISAIKLIHDWQKKKINKYPDVMRQEKFLWTLTGIIGVFRHWLKLVFSFPYRGFSWHDRSQDKKDIVVLTLSTDETSAAMANAKIHSVSLNSQLVWAIQKSCADQIKKSRWILPVWLPKKQYALDAAPIRNHSSILEVDLHNDETPKSVDQKIKTGLHTNGEWFWAKSFDLLNILLKYPFKILVFISLKGLKRTGTISNLGRFEGEFSGPMMIVPPALENTPVSFAILTYNNMLTVAVQSKPQNGPHSLVLANILKNVKTLILNVRQTSQ